MHYFCGVIYITYNDESEKWIVAEKCLKMFDFFVKRYEINPADFLDMEKNTDEYPSPGFYIMLEMNKHEMSEFLIFFLLNEVFLPHAIEN